MLRLSYRGTFAYVVNPKIEVERNMILTFYLITAKPFERLEQIFRQLYWEISTSHEAISLQK